MMNEVKIEMTCGLCQSQASISGENISFCQDRMEYWVSKHHCKLQGNDLGVPTFDDGQQVQTKAYVFGWNALHDKIVKIKQKFFTEKDDLRILSHSEYADKVHDLWKELKELRK